MSDLISSLLARSFGTAQTVQPRLPALFEPHPRAAGAWGMHAEDTSALLTNGEKDSPPRFPPTRAVSPQIESRAIVPRSEPWMEKTEESDSPSPPSVASMLPKPYDWRESTKPSRPREEHFQNLVTESQDCSLNKTRRTENEPPDHAMQNQRFEEESRALQPSSLAVSSRPRPAPDFARAVISNSASTVNARVSPAKIGMRALVSAHDRGLQIANSASEPAVHITIGRVEVRAVFPEPSVRPAPPSKNHPSLSLDDYLKKRSRGTQ